MKGWKAGLMAILVGLGMSALVGCGGSKAPVKSTQQSISPLDMSAGYGTVTLSVQWPKGKSRVVPEATERIVARLKRSGMTLFEKVIERGQTQVVFEKVPVGEWVLEAEAWGSGVVKQLVHAKGVVMAGNQPVSGAQVRLTVGTQTYTATTDGQGKFDLGLVEWFWDGELRVTASGYPEWVGWVNASDFIRSSEGLVVDMERGGISKKRQWTQEVVLASGATSFSLGANENKQVEVTLASKLTDLHVTPSEIRLGVGSEVEVAVQGKIEQEAGWTPNYVRLILVPLSGGKVNWQVADSSVASLSATSGLSVTVRGLREGQTTLTVTDTESGKSKQVRVEVVTVGRFVVVDSTTRVGIPRAIVGLGLNEELQDWTLTDAQGQFSFENIPPNAVFFAVAQGYKWAVVPATQQQIMLEKKPTISNPVTLQGEVKNNGQGIPNVVIWADYGDEEAGEEEYAVTDEQGRYSMQVPAQKSVAVMAVLARGYQPTPDDKVAIVQSGQAGSIITVNFIVQNGFIVPETLNQPPPSPGF